jgi:C2 domain.
MGKMDPFVELEYKGKKEKSPEMEDAGKKPVWNHTVVFHILNR